MIIIIPVRLKSSRMVWKPLQLIDGKPIMQHTYEHCIAAASLSKHIEAVYLAVDDELLVKSALEFTDVKNIIPTSKHFKNGTERCAAVAQILDLPRSTPVINVQGDNYNVECEAILYMADILHRHPGYQKASTMYAMCEPLNPEDVNDLSIVKVIRGNNERALFFTRKDFAKVEKHCGIYGYHVAFLERYLDLGRGELENLENLEQMRTLENGLEVICPMLPKGVSSGDSINTLDDLMNAKQLIEEQR